MSIIKEWKCAEHGVFEGSHAICPNFGCSSANVERAFLTPVGVGSAQNKRFDAGLRRTVDGMGLGNLRSSREGEASYGGDRGRELGQEVLWGNEVEKRPEFRGMGMSALMHQAQQPLTVTHGNGTSSTLTENNGMREAARDLGITSRALPTAERTTHKRDVKP